MNRRKHMSQAEAVAEFRREVIPELKKRYGKLTKTTVGSAWVEYIDELERAEYISMKQAASWGNPFNR